MPRFLWVLAAFGLVPIVLYCLQFELRSALSTFGTSVTIGLAAAAVGGLLGFLFGIPRAVIQADRSGQSFESNTNLEQVSDWLTKILIGLGLAQLGAAGTGLSNLGHTLAKALGDTGDAGQVFGVSVVLYYAILGFMLGYLPARLSLPGMLQDAEARLHHIEQQLPAAEGKEMKDAAEAAFKEPVDPSDEDRRKALQLNTEVRQIEATGVPISAQTYRRMALELKRTGHYAEAAITYLKAAEADPTDVTALNFAGVLYSKYLHDYSRAAELYERAIRLDPTYTSAVYNSACNEARRGNRQEALLLLRSAIRADPTRYRKLAQADAELENGAFVSLRDDPVFRELVSEPPGHEPPSVGAGSEQSS
jgi:tetratricopeptide (TPR) repeat protein